MSFAGHNVMKGMRRTMLAALGLTVLGITAAWATPVTTWHYDINSSFNTGATTFTSGGCATTNMATTLAWGCPSPSGGPQSSLVLDPSTATGVSVDTFFGGGTPPAANISDPGIILTHNNFVIKVPDGVLTSAELDATITLTPFTPPGPPQAPIPLTFGIQFTETPNSGTCADTTSPTPCNDIFVFDKSSLNQSFSFDGSTYFLSLFPASDNGGSLNFLTMDECTAAGAEKGCFGFTTIENQSNALHFGLSITSRPIGVPEPGALGMLGFGLLGLGGLVFLRRRRPSVD